MRGSVHNGLVFFLLSCELEHVVQQVDEIVEIFSQSSIEIFVIVRHHFNVFDQQTFA